MVGIVSLSPWDPGQCSEQQSSRSSGYQNYEQCSGLCWRQESVLSAIRAPLKRYELLHFFQDAPVVRATVKSLENHPWFMLKTLQPNLYLSGPGQSVTRLSDTDVQTELTDLEIPHGIFSFSISHYQALYFDLKLLRAQYEKRRLSQQRPLENMDNTGFSFCYIPACCWLSSGVQECSGSPSSSTSPWSRRPPQWRPARKE